MNLSDHFQDAVSDAQPDLDRLGRVARTQGTRALRRRRAGLAVSSLAGVAVLVLGTSVLLHPSAAGRGATFAGDPAPTTPTPTPSLAPGPPPTPAFQRPTARGVVAALADLSTQLAPGTTDEYAGQGDVDPSTQDHHEIYSQLSLHPEGDPGTSVIGVNIQPGMDYVASCDDSYTSQCTHTTRADGTQVTTYVEHTIVSAGTGIRWVADVLHPDGDRVVISATNGYDLPSSQWDITRPEPALTLDQLADLATRPLWLGDFPASYDQAGQSLSPYTDYDAEVDATEASPSP